MACSGCSEAQTPQRGPVRTFAFPLDGVLVQVNVLGTVTARNLTLVKQYLGLVYEAIEDLSSPEGDPHGR